MSQTIKLKRGFDINLVGKAPKKIIEIPQSDTFALKPMDFVGLSRPKLVVKEGENVKAGSPICFERNKEDIFYTSPVSGEIVEIKRGEKRKILEIKILGDKEIEFEQFNQYSVSEINTLSKERALEQLKKSGAWANVIQRPYGSIADPDETPPKTIMISSFDSHPLAPDYSFVLTGQEHYFQAGIDIIKKFTKGIVHLNVDGKKEIPSIFSQTQNVQLNKIVGIHPAGNVGVQIHHIDPIAKGDIVWTLNPVGVAQIGRLFTKGIYDTSRLVAITGSQMKETGYAKIFAGSCLNKLSNKVKEGDNRYISGNVLTGNGVGKEGYMGYYHNQITVIPEGKKEEFLGWVKPSTTKLSFHKAFGMLSFLNGKNKDFVVDTNTYGEERNFVISGTFEKVTPMDILPTYLFKAILAEDYEEMEALGIYELIEEDVALCEFVDVSKNPLQEILREGLELIKEG